LTVEVNALELHDVSVMFGAITAVQHVQLSFVAGGRYGILGANGAGKTTLFNIISGEIAPTHGRVVLNGEDITRLAVPQRIRRGLRRTFQSSRVFKTLSIQENLALAVQGQCRSRLALQGWDRPGVQRDEAQRLLDISGLHSLARNAAGALSHGQQRQLEIAMALAGNAHVILFDEPAAGLSPHEREQLAALLARLPVQACLVMIEHDLDIALRFASHITVMHQGRVFREGTPKAIASDADVQAIYMGGRHGN